MQSLTGEPIDPRTVQGDQPMIKCSNVLDNQMQCPRPAQLAQSGDPDNRKALCGVCYTLLGLPAGYNVQVGRAVNVNSDGSSTT